MTLVEVKELEAGYGRFPVLHNVTLDIGHNEIVGLVGPNGAGKTTLVRALCRVLPLMQGRVYFDGQRLDEARLETLSEYGVGLVPQGANTFPALSVEDNLKVALPRGTRELVNSRVKAVLELFPQLSSRRRQRADTLSGGERQMLALAGAMMAEPRFLALDEPTTGLAPTIVSEVVSQILQLRDQGSSILWVIEEKPMEILGHCDRVYVMQAGSIVASEAPSALIREGGLERWFFGVSEAEKGNQ